MTNYMEQSDIGMVGLGTMGSALAKNIASRDYRVSVYNRDSKRTKRFLRAVSPEQFFGAKTYKALVASIARPRKIMLMVTAGDPVDAVIDSLLPHLSKGDIIIDGGNAHYRDTERRHEELKKKGIHFVGCGVSGGEAEALHGPSLMVGGSKRAWRSIRPMFETIAAKDFSGGPCVGYFGEKGAGHYIKMVHNGIEYGVMQLIAESYALLRDGYGLSSQAIADIFRTYNRGMSRSFLLEAAVSVLSKECDARTKNCLVDHILDSVSQKGTGTWTAIDALERGVAIPTIIEAVFSRFISGEKGSREALHAAYAKKMRTKKVSRTQFERLLGEAFEVAVLCVFAQGFSLIGRAAKQEKWSTDLAEVARVWQGGCIIRTRALDSIQKEYTHARIGQFLLLPSVERVIKRKRKQLATIVSVGAERNIALPGFSSSLGYFLSTTTNRLPANLVAGLRDYFGAHGYRRVDKSGTFHTDWEE